MNYLIEGLSPKPFQHLFGMSDAELKNTVRGASFAMRQIVFQTA